MNSETSSNANKPRVTRKEIADLAGVSVSVVSRAINNSGYVSKDAKKRILDIASQLNYIPNPVAATLQERRTKLIIFFCKDLHNSFYVDVYQGMMEEAARLGYLVFLSGDTDFEKLRDTMVDGVILQNETFTVEYDNRLGKNYYLPVVAAGYGSRFTLKKTVPVVEWDLYQGMELCIEYLEKKGHTLIAYAGPYPADAPDMRTLAWTNLMRPILQEKLPDYYLGIHHSENLPFPETAEFKADYKDSRFKAEEEFFRKGVLAARLISLRKLNVTAVISFNDEFAFGMMQEFQKEGIRIPDDISLISFDGSYRRKCSYPKMTCVTGYPRKQGALLVSTLVDMIEGHSHHYVTRISSSIVEGDSVKNLRK